MKLKINLVEAKSIFMKSGLPGSDWVINPYNGCLFGCMYCYAAQIARWKHPDEEWGSYLDVKINAPVSDRSIRRNGNEVSSEEKINDLLDKLQEIGVKEVWFEHINLSPKIKARLFAFLKKESPRLISEFENANTEEYRAQLEIIIHKAMKGRNLKMGLGKIIHHQKVSKKK